MLSELTTTKAEVVYKGERGPTAVRVPGLHFLSSYEDFSMSTSDNLHFLSSSSAKTVQCTPPIVAHYLPEVLRTSPVQHSFPPTFLLCPSHSS
jgi:hypothetical protein